MMLNLDNIDFDVVDPSNPLKISAQGSNTDYWEGFKIAFNAVYSALQPKVIEKLLIEKFFLGKIPFNHKQYIEYSCELSVHHYFCKADEFAFEKQLNSSKKDVDLFFKIDAVEFCADVKCPTFEQREKGLAGHDVSIHTDGRLPDRSVTSVVKKALTDVGFNPGDAKNADNNLKDYLLSCQEKFFDPFQANQCGMLIVGCSDVLQMNEAYRSLTAGESPILAGGLIPLVDFNKVGLICITNLYDAHKFHDFYGKKSWDLGSLFFIHVQNIHPVVDMNKAIDMYLKIYDKYTKEFTQYLYELSQSPEPEVATAIALKNFALKFDSVREKSELLKKDESKPD